jgi:hypothetical protein
VETPRTPVARHLGCPTRVTPGSLESVDSWSPGHGSRHTSGGKPTPVPVPAHCGAVDWQTAAPSEAGHVPGDHRPPLGTHLREGGASPRHGSRPKDFRRGNRMGPSAPTVPGFVPACWRRCASNLQSASGRHLPSPGMAAAAPLPHPRGVGGVKVVTWLILPVVICLSQRLSHACLSISKIYSETANGSLNQLSFI